MWGVCWSAPAWARPSPKDYRAASKFAAQARRAARQKKPKKAARLYRRADRLVPRASYKLEMARLLVKLGDLVQAASMATKAAKAKPAGFAQRMAVRSATKLAAELEERVPTLTITIVEPSAALVRVKLDGDDFEVADGAVPLNAGSYQISAEAKGFKSLVQTV